jgi:hypothetical protein
MAQQRGRREEKNQHALALRQMARLAENHLFGEEEGGVTRSPLGKKEICR